MRGRVFSIERVKHELVKGDDELASWAQQLGERFFLYPTSEAIDILKTIGEWADEGGFKWPVIEEFMQGADCYLVAQALAGGFDVVTHETYSSGKRRIKIPNVCEAVGVKYLTSFEMLRREGVRFILDIDKD